MEDLRAPRELSATTDVARSRSRWPTLEEDYLGLRAVRDELLASLWCRSTALASDFTISDVLDFLAGWSVPTTTDFARSRRPPSRSQQQQSSRRDAGPGSDERGGDDAEQDEHTGRQHQNHIERHGA